MKLYSKIENGKINPYVQDAFNRGLSTMEGKTVEISVKPRRRSTAANAFRWGVVNQTILNALNEHLAMNGLPLASAEDVDIFIKDKALGVVHEIPTPWGTINITGRLRDKTSAEFWESIEAIRAWAAERGIIIPFPNEDKLEEMYKHNLERE